MSKNIYVCTDCGREIKDSEVGYVSPNELEYRDIACPYCKGSLEVGIKCIDCGEYVAERYCVDEICEDCLKKYITFDSLVKYIKDCCDKKEWAETIWDIIKEIPESFVSWIKEIKAKGDKQC